MQPREVFWSPARGVRRGQQNQRCVKYPAVMRTSSSSAQSVVIPPGAPDRTVVHPRPQRCRSRCGWGGRADRAGCGAVVAVDREGSAAPCRTFGSALTSPTPAEAVVVVVAGPTLHRGGRRYGRAPHAAAGIFRKAPGSEIGDAFLARTGGEIAPCDLHRIDPGGRDIGRCIARRYLRERSGGQSFEAVASFCGGECAVSRLHQQIWTPRTIVSVPHAVTTARSRSPEIKDPPVAIGSAAAGARCSGRRRRQETPCFRPGQRGARLEAACATRRPRGGYPVRRKHRWCPAGDLNAEVAAKPRDNAGTSVDSWLVEAAMASVAAQTIRHQPGLTAHQPTAWRRASTCSDRQADAPRRTRQKADQQPARRGCRGPVVPWWRYERKTVEVPALCNGGPCRCSLGLAASEGFPEVKNTSNFRWVITNPRRGPRQEPRAGQVPVPAQFRRTSGRQAAMPSALE